MVQCFQRFSVIQWFPCDAAIGPSFPFGASLGSGFAELGIQQIHQRVGQADGHTSRLDLPKEI